MNIPAGRLLLQMVLAPALLLPLGRGIAAGSARPDQGADAVVLEERLDVEIASETEAKVHYLNRTQVLTPRGVEAYSNRWVGYDRSVSIRDLRASVTLPSGKRQDLKKTQFSDSSDFEGFEAYSDNRKRGIHFPGVEPGAVLEYSYEESLQGLGPLEFEFQERIPARQLAFTVRAPAAMTLHLSVRGSPEYHHEESGGSVIHRWEARDVPAFRGEPYAPPLSDVPPRVIVYPEKISFGEHRFDAATWDGIAAGHRDLYANRLSPAPPVAEAARAAVAGATDPDEKIRRLYEFLQQKIRYVAVEVGIGGLQPHNNAEVYQHRYGDCKDKATLLIAMLRAVGLDGLPTLIRTRDEGLLERDHPAIVFNHAIVAIPRSGGYLFLDPTDETIPFGELPWVDQGVPVLVVKEDGHGDFVETPLAPPEQNRRHRVVTARLTPTGGLEGDFVIQTWGQRREYLSAILEQAKGAEQEDTLAEILSGLCPGAVMKGHEVDKGSRPGDPLKITIHFEVPHFILKAGSSELFSPQIIRFPQFADLSAYPERRLPVFFRYLYADTSEVRLRLPAGRTVAKLPADRKADGPGIGSVTSYEISRDSEGETLVVRRSLTVSRREIPPSDYAALRDFFSALAREDAGALALADRD